MVEKGNEYGSMNRTDIYMYIIRKDISQYISMLVTKNMFNVVCVLGHKLSVNLAVNCSRVHMHTCTYICNMHANVYISMWIYSLICYKYTYVCTYVYLYLLILCF
jgi:hypothetical protein